MNPRLLTSGGQGGGVSWPILRAAIGLAVSLVPASVSLAASSLMGQNTVETEVETPEPVPVPSYEVGKVFRDCDACPEMVVVPEGTFMMGSDEGGSDERPVHAVKIPYRLAVGKYEVTFREWDACVSDEGCSKRPHAHGERGTRPVHGISWEDIREYVDWLSRRTGEEYRLLSESEWEYVARAGTTSFYHFGSAFSPEKANFGLKFENSVPVGSYPANGFGLHDVHGNVYEWVKDCWHDDYDGAPSDGSAWVAGECDRRVMRGGSLEVTPWRIRSAHRESGGAGSSYSDVGFRVARTLAP